MKNEIEKKINKLPDKPGVYLFKDKNRKILYVGKAANLRERIKSHFQKTSDMLISKMIDKVKNIDHIVTNSEIEALLLESELIKRYKPRYNEKWKDEKNFLYIKINFQDDFPRIFYVRRPLDDRSLYFGPFVDTSSLKNSLKILRKIFPFRTCRKLPKKTCLQYHIKKCPAPCIKEISSQEYKKIIKQIILFFKGKHKKLISDVKKQMQIAAKSQQFEKAALLRDRVYNLDHLGKMIVFGKMEALDIKSEKTLLQLKDKLSLKKIPFRIECYDISNIAGKEASGSMVVFIGGLPAKHEYRRFKIKEVSQINDYAMIEEVLLRRFKKIKKVKEKILPDLVIIDGGRGQLSSVNKVLKKYSLGIPAIGLAKKNEEIYKVKNQKYKKIILNKDSQALHLVQRIRDEAHRFAIIYHRQLMVKRAKKSVLDEIYGLGPKRKKTLISYFGSVKKIKEANLYEINKVIKNEKIAQNIKESL